MAGRSIHFLIPVAVLFIFVRLAFFRQLEVSPLLELLTLDARAYHEWAVRLAQGFGHPPGAFFLSPLYPILLSGVYAVSGKLNPIAAVNFQLLLSTGTLIILFFAVRRLFDDKTAIVMSMLALLYAPWLYFDGMLLTSSLILFLNSLLLLILAHVILDKPRRIGLWLVAGIVTGLSALARPSILLFAMLLMVWLGLKKSREFQQIRISRWVAIAAMGVGIIAVLLPVQVRNVSQGSSSLLTTTSAGINFYIGNRAGAIGAYEELPWLEASDPQTEAHRYLKEAQRRTGKRLTQAQASRYWFVQGLGEIVHYPVQWIGTFFRKLWLTLQNGEIRTNLSFAAVKSYCPIVRMLPLGWGFLLPLAAAGLFLVAFQRRQATTLLSLYLATYLLVNLIFFSASEYRFPAILGLLPLAAHFFVSLFDELRERRWRRVAGALAIYIVALVLANFPSQLRAERTNPSLDFFNLGIEAVNQDRIERSIPLFVRALAAKPDFKQAHLELARSFWQVGNYDEARREFEKAHVAPPDTLHGLPLARILQEANLLREEGEPTQVLTFIDSLFPSERVAPFEVLLLRAEILEQQKGFIKAARVYQRLASCNPEDPQWLFRAAIAMRRGGNLDACDSLLARALHISPAYAPARVELGMNALARGDTASARAQLIELRRIRVPVDSIRVKIKELNELIAK